VPVLRPCDRARDLRSLYREDALTFTIPARALWTIAAAAYCSSSVLVARAYRAERIEDPLRSEREERLLALEELCEMGFIDQNEVIAASALLADRPAGGDRAFPTQGR
jgi:hypothetical protein